MNPVSKARSPLSISDVLHFDHVEAALKLAATPGAADKVIVTFG